MIPSNGITGMYVWMVGENSLLAIAQSNFLSHLDRGSKVRTHAFISNNGQTKDGISRNYGADRYYSWGDTTIDCRNNPGLVDSPILEDFEETMAESRKFRAFKNDMEERFGGLISVDPFYHIVRGEDNMRYNIRRMSKVDDFDIIRVGMRLSAPSEDTFKSGLDVLADHENPFKMKQHIMKPHPLLNA